MNLACFVMKQQVKHSHHFIITHLPVQTASAVALLKLEPANTRKPDSFFQWLTGDKRHDVL